MDSLDFFKVTNLGRINNDLHKHSKPKQDVEPKRKRWGQDKANEVPEETKGSRDSHLGSQASDFNSNSQTGRDSTTRSGYKAPKLMKSPFPEEFGHPSPAYSYKKQASKDKIRNQDTSPLYSKREEPQPSIPDLDDTFEVELHKYAPVPQQK
jgi:hypothetical protein